MIKRFRHLVPVIAMATFTAVATVIYVVVAEWFRTASSGNVVCLVAGLLAGSIVGYGVAKHIAL